MVYGLNFYRDLCKPCKTLKKQISQKLFLLRINRENKRKDSTLQLIDGHFPVVGNSVVLLLLLGPGYASLIQNQAYVVEFLGKGHHVSKSIRSTLVDGLISKWRKLISFHTTWKSEGSYDIGNEINYYELNRINWNG